MKFLNIFLLGVFSTYFVSSLPGKYSIEYFFCFKTNNKIYILE